MAVIPPVQSAANQPNAASLSLLELRLASTAFTNVTATTSAAAVVGATSITVTALSGAIPAGTVLHYASQDVTTTAAAAASATTLTVLPLQAALPSASAATYDGFVTMPLLGGISLVPADTSAAYAAYVTSGSDVWDYSVKVAMNAKLSWKTAAPDNDPAVQPFIAAGLVAGTSALVLFRFRRASGVWYTGVMPITVTFADPERGIAETMFSGNVTGKLTATFI